MSSSPDETKDDELTALFKKLRQEGREHLKNGQVVEALGFYRKAYELMPDEKLKEKIGKMEMFLTNEVDGEEKDDMVEIGNGFHLYVGIAEKLYLYQKEGLLWMWKLFLKKRGGVLGDDMGLGKTVQVVSFLSGMFDAELVKSVLLIMPVSLIPNWKKEFNTWAPGIKVHDYYTGTKLEKERNLTRAQRRGGVLITSYGMLLHNYEQLSVCNGQKFTWCYLVLDEGHKIKNPTQTTKAVYEIPAKNRLVLTGTAIQNNLRELWALFNFTHQGTLLGSLATFKTQYETPINRAREKDATAGERRLGIEIAQALKQKIAPFFLRRTKAEVLQDTENGDPDSQSLVPKLVFTAKKNDLVVWTFLSDLQKKLYKEFLESDEVANILMTKKSPLVQLTILKKICDHPRLLTKRACVQLGMHETMTPEEIEEFLDSDEGTAADIASVPDETLLEESGKMKFVLRLMLQLKHDGHRTLFFSQSRKILDIMQRILRNRAFKVTRLDGSITKLADRDRVVSQFQERDYHEVFLLTTQVGGVGLTLTAADRVIVYDPSWNPATDAQAVDRAYRIGQKKDVVVYRLVTCSTVEEKIYRRQIFKDSIIKQTTGKQRDPTRYFTKQELRELFTLEDPMYSKTQAQLEEQHSHHRNTDEGLEGHIQFLQKSNIFGVSHHDLMFSAEEKECKPEEFVPGELEHVQRRVQQAERLVSVESEVLLTEIQKDGNYTVPMNIIVRNKQPRTAAPKPLNLFPIVPNNDDTTSTYETEEVLVKPSVRGTSVEDAIEIDNVDSINRSLGNLSIRKIDKSDSILVEGSDDELFSEASNAIPTSCVIEESVEDSTDEEEVNDDKVGGVRQEVIKAEEEVKGNITNGESDLSLEYYGPPPKETVPPGAKAESTSVVQDKTSLNPDTLETINEEKESSRNSDLSSSGDPKLAVRRNLFESSADDKKRVSPVHVFGDYGEDPVPFVRKRSYHSNLTPSPGHRVTKHHASSPMVHRTLSRCDPPHSSPLNRSEHTTPRRSSTGVPNGLPDKLLIKTSSVPHQGYRIPSASTPIQTSPRRITPLKVPVSKIRSFSSGGVAISPFQKALVTSLELSPEEGKSAVLSSRNLKDCDDDESSPVMSHRKRPQSRIISDDEDSASDDSEAPITDRDTSVHHANDSDREADENEPRQDSFVTSYESSSDDETVSGNEEEAWENISQSLSSVE